MIDKVDDIEPEKIIFEGYAVESVTNVNGALDIETQFPSNGQEILYHVVVTNQRREPVEGMSTVYYQENDKSVFFLRDNLRRYGSVFLYGTPGEFSDNFRPAETGEGNQGGGIVGETNAVAMILEISVIPLSEAEIPTLADAHYVQHFLLPENTLEGNDYTIYCKMIDEVPEMIKGETDLGLASNSILISLISSDSEQMIEIASNRILDESFNFNEKLISTATGQWGLRKEEVSNGLIGLKSYFPSHEDRFSKVRTRYAYYEVELDNARCQKYILEVPEEVNAFLNTDFVDILESKGLDIHSGLEPPNVTGNYFVDNWTNLESGTRYVNYSFQFVNQTSKFKIEVRSAAAFSDAAGIIAYISGKGANFSIYSEQDHNINDTDHTVYIKTADIYSGELTPDGILNFQNGFIILEKENDYYDRFLNVGDSRVVYEADYFADAVEAFPYNAENLDPEESFRRAFSEMN